MEQLLVLDWIFLLVLLVSLCLGLMSGLVQAVIALGSWFVSYGVAQWGAKDLSVMLPLEGYEAPIPFMLAFALLFIASFMSCTLVSWLLQRFLQAVGLRPIDRLLGAVFGFVRGFLVLVVVVSVVHLTPVRKMQWWQQSKGQDMVLSAISMFQPLLPQEFTRYLPVWHQPVRYQPAGSDAPLAGSSPSAAPSASADASVGGSVGGSGSAAESVRDAANGVVEELANEAVNEAAHKAADAAAQGGAAEALRQTEAVNSGSETAAPPSVQPMDDLEALIQMQQQPYQYVPDGAAVDGGDSATATAGE